MFNETDVLRTTLHLTILITLISTAFRISAAVGFLLGGLIGFLTFWLLAADAAKLLRDSALGAITRDEASRRNWRSFIRRCLLYAGALIAAVLNHRFINFYAVFAGLLFPRLAIAYHYIRGGITRGT